MLKGERLFVSVRLPSSEIFVFLFIEQDIKIKLIEKVRIRKSFLEFKGGAVWNLGG